MQAIISNTTIAISLDNETDRQAVRNLLNKTSTEREFLADLLNWSQTSGLFVADTGIDTVDAPVVTDVPIADEDGAMGVGVWAYQGAEAMGERLLRQGAVSLTRLH
ncbi:hypothetical protein GALL_460000 [mine drainage metagenome]|uniref:Uncharacterized protein n=1 Tax=mine drainage metagenome TaxID=410659 RepID=A0A1J5PLG0_9ZZZZ